MNAVLKSISVLALLLLMACGKDDVTAPSQEQGEIRMHLVDSPAAAESVIVAVTRVEVHSAGSDSTSGWVVVNDQPATYDLLKLRNGASAILGNTKLNVGRYTQIRLILGAGSYIKIGGIQYNLEVASGFQTGIKLNHTFEIEAGTVYELYLDFDAERSIKVFGGGQYRLSPVIRVQAAAVSGSISGSVSPSAVQATIWTTVGSDTVSTTTAADGSFKLMALTEGTYTIHVESTDSAYLGTTVSGVVVTRQQVTSVGTVTMTLK